MNKRIFITSCILCCLFGITRTQACVDVTANELGWVFQLADGNMQLFGFRVNDATGLSELIAVKTKPNGDTLSIKTNANLPLTFSYSDFMDRDSVGNFIIGGIRDSTNSQYFRIITLDQNADFTRSATMRIPSDSLEDASSFDWRNIHGLGYLFFGVNKSHTEFSLAFLATNGQVYYTAHPIGNVKYMRIGDATLGKQYGIVTGDYTDGSITGTFVDEIDGNGQIVKQILYPNKEGVTTNATLLTVAANHYYINGYYTDNQTYHSIRTMKLDLNLDTVWTKNQQESYFDHNSSLSAMTILGSAPAQNDNLVLLLKSLRGNLGSFDLMANLDSNCNQTWNAELNQYNSWIFNFLQDKDQQIVMAGAGFYNQSTDLHLIVLNGTSGINNSGNTTEDQVQIYPNPSHGVFYVQAPAGFLHDASLAIYDIMGRPVFATGLYSSAQQISTGTLPAGLYEIRLSKPNGAVYLQKIIVQ